MTKKELTYVLSKHKLTPDHAKGQNFLIDNSVFEKIISTAALSKDDTIVEVGPGVGSLTAKLCEEAGSVIAIEVDERFRPILSQLQSVYSNLTVVYEDILRISIPDLLPKGTDSYKIVANIPYYLTSKLFSTVLTLPNPPENMLVLVQKEVAERVCARAGDHSRLSLAVQLYGKPKIASIVSRTSFYPAPEVDSALLSVTDIRSWSYDVAEKKVWQLIRIGFSSRRKKLLNNIAAGYNIEKNVAESYLMTAGIKPDLRAEDLTIEQWLSIAKVITG